MLSTLGSQMQLFRVPGEQSMMMCGLPASSKCAQSSDKDACNTYSVGVYWIEKYICIV